MSLPTTAIGFSPTTPAPSAGYQNVIPQTDGGSPLQRESFQVPGTGGVSVQTSSYTAVAGDCGLLIVFSSSSAVTLTLPASVPFARWTLAVANLGGGALKVAPGGSLTLDGLSSSSASLPSLSQYQGLQLATDGSNYFSSRGVGSGGGGGSTVTLAPPYVISGASKYGPIFACNPPNDANFTSYSNGAATIYKYTSQGSVILWQNGGAQADMFYRPNSSNVGSTGSIRVKALLRSNPHLNGIDHRVGVFLEDPTSGKAMSCSLGADTYVRLTHWSAVAPTPTYGGSEIGYQRALVQLNFASAFWIALLYDLAAGQIQQQYSHDGVTWNGFLSESGVTSYLPNRPTRAGVYWAQEGNTGLANSVESLSLDVETGSYSNGPWETLI